MCILFAVPPFFPLWHRLIRHPSKVHLERLGAHRLEVMSMYRFSSRPRSPRFILGGASSLSSSSHTREWLHSTVALKSWKCELSVTPLYSAKPMMSPPRVETHIAALLCHENSQALDFPLPIPRIVALPGSNERHIVARSKNSIEPR